MKTLYKKSTKQVVLQNLDRDMLALEDELSMLKNKIRNTESKLPTDADFLNVIEMKAQIDMMNVR